jgi:antitoxin (DNA-binding transcriptional repressor) of toxin-antitoxin stability system
MKTITMTDLRTHYGKYLRAIRKGKSFLVSRRGIVIAKMTPVDKHQRPWKFRCHLESSLPFSSEITH